jgi:hypothetical protein
MAAPLITSPLSSIGHSYPPPFTPGNGSHEGSLFPAAPASLLTLGEKGTDTPVEHLTASPHLLPSSIMPASWLLGVEAPSPVRHLLAVVRAPVSGSPVAPHRALPVATLVASHRGPEQPLGQAPVSPCHRLLWSPRWNSGPATPVGSTDSWT